MNATAMGRLVLGSSACWSLFAAAGSVPAQVPAPALAKAPVGDRDPRLVYSDGYWWYWNRNDTWSLYTSRGWKSYRSVLSAYAGVPDIAQRPQQETAAMLGNRVQAGPNPTAPMSSAPSTVPASIPPEPTFPSAPTQPRPTSQSPIAANPPMVGPNRGAAGDPAASWSAGGMPGGNGNALGTGPGSLMGADNTTGWFDVNRLSNPMSPNQPVGAGQSPIAVNPPMAGPNKGAAGNPALPPPGAQMGVSTLPNGR